MVKVEVSKCICGKCRKEFYMEWEFDITGFSEEPMGECVWYEGEGQQDCPECGNILYGKFSAMEYPAGTLETISEIKILDSAETEKSEISSPIIRFFDI